MRIFVSVGTHPQPFDRLLRELDFLVESGGLDVEVFAQTGSSSYKPRAFPSKAFLSAVEYDSAFRKADVVVSHGGAGTIINALRRGKKLVVVPRLKRFNEHTNDHQVDLASALAAEGKCIAVFDVADLGRALNAAKRFKPRLACERQRLVLRLKSFFEAQRR